MVFIRRSKVSRMKNWLLSWGCCCWLLTGQTFAKNWCGFRGPTGDEVWRVERDEKSNGSTPYLWKNTLRTELVTSGGHRMA